MYYVEQTLQYAIFELKLAFLDLTLVLTESSPKPLRFIHGYFNEMHYDTQRSFAKYINEFY